jgi:hypothetical protein
MLWNSLLVKHLLAPIQELTLQSKQQNKHRLLIKIATAVELALLRSRPVHLEPMLHNQGKPH